MPSVLGARLHILIAVVLMSLGGAGIKLCSFGPWQVGGFRSAFAALTVFFLLREARRHWSWKVIPVGAAFAGTLVLFVWGNKTTTAANTIFIQSSAPLWVLLLSPLLLKEQIRLKDVISMLIFGVGLALFFLAPEKATRLSPEITKGNWLALAAGVCFALTIMGLRGLRGHGAEASIVCGNCFAFLICLLPQLAGPWGTPDGFMPGAPRDWLTLLFLGSVQIGLAYILYVRGLRTVLAVHASLIGLIEAVLNPLWVFLIFHEERPGPYAILGGAIILAATAYQVIGKPAARRA